MAFDTPDSETYGVTNHSMGKITGTGAAIDVTLGFAPRMVRVVNVTDRITDEKYAQMGSTEVLRTVAAGTRTLDTSSMITFADQLTAGRRGFTIAAAAAINAKDLYWEAFG